MNLLGFLEVPPGSTSTSNDFMIVNTRSLGSILGFDDDMEIRIIPLVHPRCARKTSVVGCQTMPGTKAIITYNQRLIDQKIGFLDTVNGFLFLWVEIVRALRLLIVTNKQIPVEELVPVKSLTDFGYSKTFQTHLEGFVREEWSEAEARREADLLFISSYLGTLIRVLCSQEIEVDPRHLAFVIGMIRRDTVSTLMKFLP